MSLGAKQIRAATMWLGHLAGTGRRRPSPLASPSSESSEDEAVGRSQPPLMRNPTKSLWKRLSAGSGAPPSPAASAASTAATAMTPSGASSTASSAEVHLENLEMTEDCQCPWPAEDPEEVHVLWERALAGRHVTELSTAELRALVLGRGGAPHDQRLDLWSSLFANTAEDGAETAMTNDSAVPEAARRQIDLDVPRTRPEWLGEEEREALRSVLHDFVAANPDVGYCQGLNNVAAVFVRLGFGRAASLRGLETLTREVCPGYHGPRLAGWLRDARVLDRLVRRLLPGAVDKLDALGVPLEVLAADHFLTLGSRSWPLTATAQLWDLLFLEGQPALFASFLALLDLYLPDCGACEWSEEGEELEPVEIFRRAAQRGVEVDFGTVVERMAELIPSVPLSLLESLRDQQTGQTLA